RGCAAPLPGGAERTRTRTDVRNRCHEYAHGHPCPRTGRELMNTSPLPHDGPAPATGEAHVLVLSGGLSHERDVSIKSGRRVAQVLRSAGFGVTLGDVDTHLLRIVPQTQPDVVRPRLHRSTGQHGSHAAPLSLAAAPTCAPAATATRVSCSRATAKAVVARSGG